MATQTIRCIYCDFTCKRFDTLQGHTELKHPEVVKRDPIDDIRQMQKDIRETKLKFEIDILDGSGLSGVAISLEELCAQCKYKEPSEGGWCYMFKDKPVEVCYKFETGRG